MALDIMEPVRPMVEECVLDLAVQRSFRKADFTETSDGNCRLLAPLTHELASMMPIWAQRLAPIAEKVAHSLGQAMAGKYVAVTPLTRKSHRQAAALVKARKATMRGVAANKRDHQRPTGKAAPTLWSCPDCGGSVSDPRRVRCDACVDGDPRHAPGVRKARGTAISSRKRAIREWEEANPDAAYDPEFFRRDVLPRLGSVKLADIMAAAGISKGYASQVRAGKATPHVSTWGALARLVGARMP